MLVDSEADDGVVNDIDGEAAAGDTFGAADVTAVVDWDEAAAVGMVGDVSDCDSELDGAVDAFVAGDGVVEEGVGAAGGVVVRDCVMVLGFGVLVGEGASELDGVDEGLVEVVSTLDPTFPPGWASRR